ncbi:MAG: nucleoside triphosphate pyrophosphohydrolase [Thermodesulfobacteriota bacterium]
MEKTPKNHTPRSIEALIQLIEKLRGENGCPWDKKQTSRSMALYLVEEMYELVDAIEKGNPDDVCEELGDVLFHIFFIARLFEETGRFTIGDVAAGNVRKMTRRHPHVFGSTPLESAEAVKRQWHTIKTTEKKPTPGGSLLDSLPPGLPALMRAYRISERVSKAGFDWSDMQGVLTKVEEEWNELKSAIRADDNAGSNHRNVSLEFGDLVFTLVNVARFARIHPETATADATNKFEARFRQMERLLAAAGRTLESLSEQEMNLFWEKAKTAAGHSDGDSV